MTTSSSRDFTWRDTGILAVLFVVTRLALVVIGVVVLTSDFIQSRLPSNEGEEFTHLLDGGAALDMWYRWDAGFYASIATYGYDWQNEMRPADDMAFLPVYPLLVRAASGMGTSSCPLSPYLSTCATIGGLIISNITLFLSSLLLFWLTLQRFDKKTAWRVVFLLLVSPISIFLSGVYTESIFLLFSLLTFVALERKQFLLAVAAAVIAALTRSVGMALCAGLLWYAWFGSRQFPSGKLARLGLALLPGIVFASYVLLMGLSVGEPLAYFSTYEQTWNRTAGTPIEAFTIYFSGQSVSMFGWSLSWLDLILTLFYLALAIILIVRERRARQGEGVYALGALAIPITSGTLVGMPRFGAALFPFYILLGRWADRPWRMVLVYGVSIALNVLFVVQFVRWRWIA
jgi:Gpi18-like mannosyltransferase